MTESKKAWFEPELIVLVRSKPEETVLAACKSTGSGLAPASDFNGCAFENDGCDSCNSWGVS